MEDLLQTRATNEPRRYETPEPRDGGGAGSMRGFTLAWSSADCGSGSIQLEIGQCPVDCELNESFIWGGRIYGVLATIGELGFRRYSSHL